MATSKSQQDQAQNGAGESQQGGAKSGGANGAGTNGNGTGETEGQPETPAAEVTADNVDQAPAATEQDNGDSANGAGSAKSRAQDLFSRYRDNHAKRKTEQMSFEDYLERCAQDSMTYATAAERLLNAIGEPEIVDTSKDERLGQIFQNKKVPYYPGFKGFYGLEKPIEGIVKHVKHAAQGLEEAKQILYLLGPVGGGKSSIAEQMKKLMEQNPIYVLAFHKGDAEGHLLYTDPDGNHVADVRDEEGYSNSFVYLDEDGDPDDSSPVQDASQLKAAVEYSPINESPLGMFDPAEWGETLTNEFGIPERYQNVIPSPWANKRLEEVDGDLSRFLVVKRWPSALEQLGVAKTEPADENNQDVSNLTGAVDIRKVEKFAKDDPDAFDYAGGLNKTTQGMLEFVEMFKAPLKTLHPLLTSTQEGHYAPPEGLGPHPYQGVILAHSNESEWQSFKSDKKNEAFLDRVNLKKVPYCLRVDEEVKIYEKLLKNSDLARASYAPGTLDMMAKFSILSRLEYPTEEQDLQSLVAKMRVYNGEVIREEDVKKVLEMKDYDRLASQDEGMDGFSTRFAYKVLSETFNHHAPPEADPVDLMYYLKDAVQREQLGQQEEKRHMEFINYLTKKFHEALVEDFQEAYVESYQNYGQNMFENYIYWANAWVQGQNFVDPNTHDVLDKDKLEEQLKRIEQYAGIGNPATFRRDVVLFAERHKDQNGALPDWRSYEPIRNVIKAHMHQKFEDILPTIEPGQKQDSEQAQKRDAFVQRMLDKGYSSQQQVDKLAKWAKEHAKNEIG